MIRVDPHKNEELFYKVRIYNITKIITKTNDNLLAVPKVDGLFMKEDESPMKDEYMRDYEDSKGIIKTPSILRLNSSDNKS